MATAGSSASQIDLCPEPYLWGMKSLGRGPFGNLDLAGNVWEWCHDTWSDSAYKERQAIEAVDPVVAGQGSRRVVRGGSWISSAGDLDATRRYWQYSRARESMIGLRIVVLQSPDLDSLG